jgi:tetratricopeptide (TPR) repeat protein
LTKTPFAFRASAQVKSNPRGSLDEAEKLITQNPANVQAHQLLGAAATALGMMQTAVFAYECVRELEPDNIKNLLALAGAMMDAGQNKEAIKVCDHILDLAPGNGDAQALVRKASVSISMDKGKWEEQGGDFRSKLADADTAAKLEQANRTVNDADTAAALIADLTVKVEKEPENMTYYRDIIGHYKQQGRFDDALVWVRKARQMPQGKADATFEKWETDFVTATMKTKITELETALAAGPDPEKQKALDELRKQELEFRLQQAKVMVDKYPNDYGYRYEYGTLLYETGQIDAAIRELQFSRRNPKVAQQAMLQLGRAYRKKGILDLAEEQLESAKREITAMNDLKKEVIYELGTVYQENKKADKAIDEFKAIYANDIDYRDVAKIINDYYEKKSRG